MAQFEYVAVLISIIVGLALAQILRGVGRIVTSRDGPRPYWVHLLWTLWLFCFIALFWWWEFNLISVDWNIYIYLVWIIYATLVFFASLVLHPSDISDVTSYKEYFYRNRRWFFSLVIAFSLWDFVDTFAKGATQISDLNPVYATSLTARILGCAIAMKTASERYHESFSILLVLFLFLNNYRIFTALV